MTKILTYRFQFFWCLPLLVIAWYLWRDPDQGRDLVEQITRLLGIVPAAVVTYGLRRAFAESIRGQELTKMMRAGSPGAAVAYAGLLVMTGLIFLAVAPRALAADAPLPAGARQYLPVLAQEVDARWPAVPKRSVLAAQVEQESGWRVHATLKTARETGVGLLQFTRAYDATGALRFDALADVTRQDVSLSTWTWADRFNPRMQLRAGVVKNRTCFGHFGRSAAPEVAMAFCDAAFNCGEGCVYARRRLCAAAQGCDATQWFGHVERHSAQSKTRWKGYGQSAHEITNTHVRNVMTVRRPKYAAWFGEV